MKDWGSRSRDREVVVTGARVREITVRKDGRADGVIYYDADGQAH